MLVLSLQSAEGNLVQRLSVEVAILCEEERSLPLGSQSTLLTAGREERGGRGRGEGEATNNG